jgi:hypothetical protein
MTGDVGVNNGGDSTAPPAAAAAAFTWCRNGGDLSNAGDIDRAADERIGERIAQSAPTWAKHTSIKTGKIFAPCCPWQDVTVAFHDLHRVSLCIEASVKRVSKTGTFAVCDRFVYCRRIADQRWFLFPHFSSVRI